MEFILQQVADNCTDFFKFLENKIFNVEEMYSFSNLWRTIQRYTTTKLSQQSVKNLVHNLLMSRTFIQMEVESKFVKRGLKQSLSYVY